ncbi:T9SS type A sorting domain-containing protein [Kaistella palustris]|uniref:T9SS type A sorting domain-containing protein n=1 Tax=Kaistella palustris TaxID=493376 RepID=UPI00146BFDA6|nr:T9SS type A sorting domain-containing protein [Kaistella palustris]
MKKLLLIATCFISCATISAQENKNRSILGATDAYVMEFFTNPGQFGTLPLAGPYYPIPNVITNNAYNMLGGDFDSANNLYTIVYINPTYYLGIVDLTSGAVNYAATISGVVSAQQFLSQLSYNVTNGHFYALSHDPNNKNGSQLYSVDIATGVLSPVGPLNSIANAISFEIDNNGMGYAADSVTGKLYTIDLSTGVVAEVGLMDQNGFYPVGQSFTIDHSTNTMYAVLQNKSGVIRSHFYTVNLSSGALTDLGDGSSRKYSLFAVSPFTLSLSDSKLHQIQAYPNPTNGNFTVALDKKYPDVSVEILNITGQIVSSQNYRESKNIISEIKGPAGIYIIKVTADHKELKSIKITKQ